MQVFRGDSFEMSFFKSFQGESFRPKTLEKFQKRTIRTELQLWKKAGYKNQYLPIENFKGKFYDLQYRKTI